MILSVTPPRSCWHPWSLIHSYIAMFETLVAKCRLAKHHPSPHQSFRHKFLSWLSLCYNNFTIIKPMADITIIGPCILPALVQQFSQNGPGRTGQCCNLQLIICLSFSMEKHGRWRWGCLPLRRWSSDDPKQIYAYQQRFDLNLLKLKNWSSRKNWKKRKVTAVDTVSIFSKKATTNMPK